MDATTGQSQLEFHRLYSAYQDAWKRLRVEVDRWQALTCNVVGSAAIEEARHRVACAEAAYRDSRNKVAECMLAKSTKDLTSDGGRRDGNGLLRTGRFRVERVAYQLWEDAGWHDGNAEADWYRAENMVQKSRTMGAAH